MLVQWIGMGSAAGAVIGFFVAGDGWGVLGAALIGAVLGAVGRNLNGPS